MFDWIARLLGTADGGAPRVRWREGVLPEEGNAIAKTYLEQVAARAELESPVVVIRKSDHSAELRAKISGLPLRIVVDFTGDIRDFALKYHEDRDREYIDIEFDPDDDGADAGRLEAWEESDEKVYLGPRVYLEGSSAKAEAAAFKRLPVDLQQRVVSGVLEHRIRYFRSRRDEHENTLWDGAAEVRHPVEWLAAIIRLSVDVALARGAAPPGEKQAQRASANAYAAAEGDDAKRTAAEVMARSIAAKVLGARVVDRKIDEAWDVRWTEGRAHLRVVLDYRFDHLEAHARADGVEVEFSLTHDRDVTIDDAPAGDDGWDVVECYVFFDQSTFLSGPRAQALREAAALRALPKPLLDELLASCRDLHNAPDLEQSSLHVVVDDLDEVTDSGDRAIAIARLYGRVVAALPTGTPAAPPGGEAHCQYCRALWFPSASHRVCTHCGAPAAAV